MNPAAWPDPPGEGITAGITAAAIAAVARPGNSACTGMPRARSSPEGVRVIEEARVRFDRLPRSKAAAQRQGRELAELTRRELDLGSDALGDVAAVIEQHFAVDVALSPLGMDADGLCVHSGPAALILASSDFPDGHVRFTLAHELAHHLLADPREVIEEAERDMFADTAAEWRANSFAGHFLMPGRGVRSVLGWLGEGPGAVSERAVVALMEHFGASMAALIYQLNIIGAVSYSAGQQLRSRGVTTLVEQHRDVAPSGAATTGGHVRRPPERLTRRALAAAREQRLGLSVVASLLERDDDEQLWDEIMAGHMQLTAPKSSTGTRPKTYTSSTPPSREQSPQPPAGATCPPTPSVLAPDNRAHIPGIRETRGEVRPSSSTSARSSPGSG